MDALDSLGLTTEQKAIYRRCNAAAREYFNLPKGWVLHHKDDTLKTTDINRYIEWRIEDLVPVTKAEHNTIHKTGNTYGTKNKGRTNPHTKEWNEKIGKSNKGNIRPDLSLRNKTNPPSANKVWYNNGIEQHYYTEGYQPDGYVRGMLKKHNGNNPQYK